MKPIVAVIAPGAMGSGVGQRLAENGVDVVTSLAGRGAASAARAKAAGMRAVEDTTLGEAEAILSIVPPGNALELAERLAPVLRAAPRKPLYVDCNAVSPDTVRHIAAVVQATGASFVDGGIIGGPPKPGSTGTKIYVSGPEAQRAVKADPKAADARLDCQIGAWLSMIGSQNNVQKGASHGIGHVLGGTADVPHGYTSCVMLPHVLRFNAEVNADRQAWISEALGEPGKAAADVVARLIADLGLPLRLRDVGVKEDMLDRIAEGSMHDRWVHTNPRRIDGPATVRKLLDAAW